MRHPRSRLRATGVLVVLVVLVAACSGGGDPSAGPTSVSPSPSPTEQADLEPVEGDVRVERKSVANTAVFNEGDPNANDPPDDEVAVDAGVSAVASWLDDHLTDLQEGGPGSLDAVAADGLLDGADASTVEAVTTGLASPEAPVEAVTYRLLVATVEVPSWISATVDVAHPDGSASAATFVFVPGPDRPILVAAGPGPGDHS